MAEKLRRGKAVGHRSTVLLCIISKATQLLGNYSVVGHSVALTVCFWRRHTGIGQRATSQDV